MTDEPSRVLLVTPDYPPPPGGIQTIVSNLEDGLESAGVSTRVLHVAPKEYDPSPGSFLPRPSHAYSIRSFVTGKFVYQAEVARQVRDAIEEFDPDVVHAMHVRNLSAIRVAIDAGIPAVLSAYALELGERALAREAIEAATVVHAISDFTATLVRDATPHDVDVHVIPPSIDIGAYRETETESTDRGPVVTMARFVERKNIETVVQAWKLLPSELRAGRELIVAGDGPLRGALEVIAADTTDVHFPRWVNGAEKRRLLNQADLFTMVPKQRGFDVEGFGIVWIEAQAAGTPVVGSKHGGAPEAIDDAGIVVEDETDPGEVANAMTRLLEDKSYHEERLKRINERIDQFDVPAVTRQHRDVYRSIAGGDRA